MTSFQTKPAFRSRHGSVAFETLPAPNKRIQVNRSKKFDNRGSFGAELARERSGSLATENLRKKSQSLPNGKIVLRNERVLSSNDVMEEKRPKLRTARSLKAIDRRVRFYICFFLCLMCVLSVDAFKGLVWNRKKYYLRFR